MPGDYSYRRRSRGLFDPKAKEPFRLSRSKIDLFVECQRCFYLDQRLGVGRPKSFPFNLNSAVDKLLKKEFDIHRAAQSTHPLLKTYGLDAVPFAHKDLEEWRDALTRGISYHDKELNLVLRGGIDDVWINPEGELLIVDYKATSKDGEVNLDAEWQDGYRRQMEIYQWLFRQNGFKVSSTGYFVYVNGKTDRIAFDGKLEFDVKLIPYTGNTDWIPKTLKTLKQCLVDERIPLAGEFCDHCGYVRAVKTAENERVKTSPKLREMLSETTEENLPISKKKHTLRKTKKAPSGHKMPTLF